MTFQLLANNLHETAIAAKEYFASTLGAKSFLIESPLKNIDSLRPTLQARIADGKVLCIEVGEKAYTPSLDSFVLECSNKGYPVKLYVVIPSSKGDPDFGANLRKAKDRGVGVVEILPDQSPYVMAEAVSLSIFGLQRTEPREFPKSRRESLQQAEQTFLNGNPVKGCQSLFEELESVTRAFAKRSVAEGWWRQPHPGEKGPKVDLDDGPWAMVLQELNRFLDIKSCRKKCPLMNPGLIGSAQGLTNPRNMTSHKPKDISQTINRDKKLRTWFESTRELYRQWCEALVPLKI